ncbi:MAG TPA: ribosome silencing factor [Thermodesulfovibrionales bacterium]|nr:ribosome silencing factor [Thermodesulfovibrionales bacterium]
MSLKSRELALTAAEEAFNKKAQDVIILELGDLTVIADYFVICSGESTTQVRTIAEFIEQELSRKGITPIGREGVRHSHWVLLDYGDVIIHVFEKETREYYGLEKLWMDARAMEFHEDTSGMGGKNKRAVHS